MRRFDVVRRCWTTAGLLFFSSALPGGILFGETGSDPEVLSITSVSPPPGFVNTLTSISVTFSQPVTGVRAGDFLVNGSPAQGVSGSGTTYRFTFAPPGFGAVDISWGTLHTIFDLDSKAQRFDASLPGSSWAYQLVNPNGPSLARILPVPGTRLRRLSEVEVSFSQAVRGVAASDLRLNGVAAARVTGLGAGPYLFSFAPIQSGPAALSWNPRQGIVTDDGAAIGFRGEGWTYTVDPAQPAPAIVVNEILAENQTGWTDEDRDHEDWIELLNRGAEPVNLGGWSLSVKQGEPEAWVFPRTVILPGSYLLVWASGKDRPGTNSNQRAHTNFKLNANGDTVRLFGPELPRVLEDQLAYPEQAPDHSFGREELGSGPSLAYFAQPTPAAPNGLSTITGKVEEVHFSVERGFFNTPFSLSLASPTPGAEIRYTLDGSPPNLTNGTVYLEPVAITATCVVRAAAFCSNQLPSRVRSHTYLMKLPANRRFLPVLSLVSATNNLYGRSGIMEYNPRNTTQHGPAWERPVSVEWIRPEDNSGFQLDAGLRVAGGDYIRGLYNYRSTSPPQNKYSFRLYFRGEYGPGHLDYPLFPESTLDSFDSVHLRAGMNDPTNPFLKDEFVRELSLDVGLTACHGTFVYLYLNGVYKGLYNPCERLNNDFLQAYRGGGPLWDVIGPNNQVLQGDSVAWNQLRVAARRDLTQATNYLDVAGRMDLTNFIDYLLPLIWADNDDWPHNNTRAAREKVPGAPFRFYPWDAEFSFSSHPVSNDTIATTLSSLNPPWGTTDYQAMFNSLKKSAEFKLLFADRVHRAFFNGGPLTDDALRARYARVKAQAAPSIPGFSDIVGTWINGRRKYVLASFQKAGFLASSNAPVANPFGEPVPARLPLALTNLGGAIFYTTDGSDPRAPFSGLPSANARRYDRALPILAPLHLKARSLDGTNWSALVDLVFDPTQGARPIRITEIMYHPVGGDAFEFVELQNTGTLPLNLSGDSFVGIQFRFPDPSPELPPGARLVLANDFDPEAFRQRYPNASVAGWFSGSLDNGGERIALLDPRGRELASVTYGDDCPWPKAADGQSSSLEMIDPNGDPDDPTNWQASAPGGSPGAANPAAPQSHIRINELQAEGDPDWIELYNPGPNTISLAGWSLTDSSDPRRFVFPSDSVVSSGGFLVVECNKGKGSLAAPFHLNRQGETIALLDPATNRVDAVRFGPAVPGYTLGLVGSQWTLCVATAGAANQSAWLGSRTDLQINEFLANSNGGGDWLELYNLGSAPVSLQGCAVATSNAVARIAAPVFVGPSGFFVLQADNAPGPNHLPLKLPAAGGWIALLAPDGTELSRVDYPAQASGVSMGRMPNGSGSFQALPFSPTPGASNDLAETGTRLRFSEVLARALDGPDWIEIENASPNPIPLPGYWVGVQEPGRAVAAFRLSHHSQISAGERQLIYFGPSGPSQAIPADADRFPTALRDEGAVLTLHDGSGHILDRLEYGLQVPGQTIGRSNDNWALRASPTPGGPNSMAAHLDPGTQLRLNEWLASGTGTNDFVELFNPAPWPVLLSGWVLSDDPSICGSTNHRIASLSFIGARAFATFQADRHPELGADHTAFQLSALGESLRLFDPAGSLVDGIDYGVQADLVSEGRYPDGADALVAFPGSPSPGAPNYFRRTDADQDGMDDDWERARGLDPTSPSDAAGDVDGDGASNLQEFLAGTDPRDPSDRLRLEVLGAATEIVRLRFAAHPGIRYTIQYCDRLAPQSWRDLVSFPAATSSGEVRVDDPTPPGERPTRFYRITVQ